MMASHLNRKYGKLMKRYKVEPDLDRMSQQVNHFIKFKHFYDQMEFDLY